MILKNVSAYKAGTVHATGETIGTYLVVGTDLLFMSLADSWD